jgi:hypothetical protein
LDIATGAAVTDGLAIDITPRPTGRSVRASVSSGGIWWARDLPGLRRYETGEADDINARRAARRPFRITIDDPAGRYLAVAFNADLPTDDLFVVIKSSSSPSLSLWPTSPPLPGTVGVPLFSAPSRAVPGTLGVVRAELREAGTERPAAWALLAANVDGIPRGIGLADTEGRVLVLFPYPALSQRAAASPPVPTAFRWIVELTAYYTPRPSGAPTPDLPDLSDLLLQLAAPRRPLASVGSPTLALGPLQLDDRVPLVVRSGLAPPLSPYLYIETA